MPASPFGLAYGLGAGMAIAPQVMQQRQAAQNQLAMQGLQQQLMQHQVAQQQAEDQAFSQPVAPQMDQPTTQQSMQAVLGTPAPMGPGGIPMAPGTVQGGPSPTLAQATAPTKHQYTTPYEKMAYEMGQRADKLASMGFGRSAMALQQQAAQFNQLHTDTLRGRAVQGIIGGQFDQAKRDLASLGMNVANIQKIPAQQTADGYIPEAYVMTDANGNNTVATSGDLAAISADPKQVGALMEKQHQYDAMYGRYIGAATIRANTEQKKIDASTQQKELDRQNRIELANIRASMPSGLRGGATTADERKVQALVRDTGITPEEAWNRIKPDISARGQITDKDRLHALTGRNANIWKTIGGAPSPGDPEYQEYMDNQKTINDLMKGGKKTPTPAGPDVTSERAMADAAIKANPNAADRIKQAFKTRTGQDY